MLNTNSAAEVALSPESIYKSSSPDDDHTSNALTLICSPHRKRSKRPSIPPNSILPLMDKKKNVTASAATGSSGSAPTAGSEAIKNLKTLIQLVDEVEELRKENEQLCHQLVAATDIIESVTAHLKAAETGLLAAIREKAEKKMELAELKERLGAKETADSHRGRWKKWLYSATATFLAFSAAFVTLQGFVWDGFFTVL